MNTTIQSVSEVAAEIKGGEYEPWFTPPIEKMYKMLWLYLCRYVKIVGDNYL